MQFSGSAMAVPPETVPHDGIVRFSQLSGEARNKRLALAAGNGARG